MTIATLLAAAAACVSAQTAAPIFTSTAPASLAASTAPAVGVTTTTVSLTTAPLSGATTGIGAPTNAPGASFTPPNAVPQPFNAPGAGFVQPGTLTPQLPPGGTRPTPPATTPQTTPQTAPQAIPQSAPSPLTPQKRTRAETEATHASMNPADRRSLRVLDEENVERHRRLHEQYVARRRLLVDSDDWKFSSWSERRSRLKSLKKEYEEREEWLRDDYLQKRDGLLRMSQGGFDELRVQGAD